ncbi:MAG: hypothetical protein ACYCQK_01385 [Acidiferrobacteraceae bacterium]
MADETLPDSQRYWDEGDTPAFTVTILDNTGTAVPLSAISSLLLTQWIDNGLGKPGTKINGRNLQGVINANNVTVASTSGLVTWSLQAADTAMQSADTTVAEERHYFRFDVTFTSGGATNQKSYLDYYVVSRKQVVKT